MGKRLNRFSLKKCIEHRNQLINIELNIVLLSGAAFHGIITKWDDHTCCFIDSGKHAHTISIHQISEIITDNISSF